MRKIGFVGAGNMAGALAKGLLATKRVRARDLWASDAEPRQLARFTRTASPAPPTTGRSSPKARSSSSP